MLSDQAAATRGITSQASWARIIGSVNSIMGLSALGVLAAGAAFAVVLAHVPAEQKLLYFIILVAFVVVLVAGNMVYAFVENRHEFTFRVVVARFANGVETPVPNTRVKLYKNGKNVGESDTDEMGGVSFALRLDRRDDYYVTVTSATARKPNRVALFATGHCQIVKRVLLP